MLRIPTGLTPRQFPIPNSTADTTFEVIEFFLTPKPKRGVLYYWRENALGGFSDSEQFPTRIGAAPDGSDVVAWLDRTGAVPIVNVLGNFDDAACMTVRYRGDVSGIKYDEDLPPIGDIPSSEPPDGDFVGSIFVTFLSKGGIRRADELRRELSKIVGEAGSVDVGAVDPGEGGRQAIEFTVRGWTKEAEALAAGIPLEFGLVSTIGLRSVTVTELCPEPDVVVGNDNASHSSPSDWTAGPRNSSRRFLRRAARTGSQRREAACTRSRPAESRARTPSRDTSSCRRRSRA